MYIEFTAYINNEGLSLELEEKIEKIIPDIDLSHWEEEDEDEQGTFAKFYYGTEEYHNEKEDLNHTIYIVSSYISLFELQKDEAIINFWINDGSQFGYRNKKKYAEEWLIELEEKLKGLVSSD